MRLSEEGILFSVGIACVYAIIYENAKGNYFTACIVLASLITVIISLILSYLGYRGRIIDIIYKITKPIVIFWFDFLKWLFILSALILAINKTHDDTLIKLLYISYICIFIYINSILLKAASSMRSKIETSKLPADDKEVYVDIIRWSLALCSGFLIIIIFMLPDIVNKLGL